jgi:hypothetical protein
VNLPLMAPGFETQDALAKSKADPNYWAKKEPKPSVSAACRSATGRHLLH